MNIEESLYYERVDELMRQIQTLKESKMTSAGETMKSIESFVDAILISLSPEEIRSLIEELTYEIDHQKEKVNTYITVSDGKKNVIQ